MRPAHSAREIKICGSGRGDLAGRFNEARAFSAGNRVLDELVVVVDRASMRPAHSAREIWNDQEDRDFVDVASMRPAHSAREIPCLTCCSARQRQALQ